MFNTQPLPGLMNMCITEYQRVVPFLPATFRNVPEHPNVGTIGQVEHSRQPVSACVSGALGTLPNVGHDWTPLLKPQQPLNAMNATVCELIEDAVLNGKDVYLAKLSPVA